MAQTFEFQINLGNGSFAGLVTGQSTTKGHTVDVLWAHWSFYGFFLPEWYRTVATSLVEHGFQGRTWYAIPLRELTLPLQSHLSERRALTLSFSLLFSLDETRDSLE